MLLVFCSSSRVIAGDHVLVRVEASCQSGQCGAAQGGGHVATAERDTLLGKLIELWCLDDWVSHKAVIRPRLVVGEDEDNVRLFVFRAERAGKQEC